MSRPQYVKRDQLDFAMSLSGMHEIMAKHVEDSFDRFGRLRPTWLIQSEGWLHLIETDWADQHEQDKSMFIMHATIHKFPTLAYSMAVEAWAAVEWIKEAGIHTITKPGNRPDREDIAMVQSFSRSDALLTRWLVNVRPEGKHNFLGPRVDEADTSHFIGVDGVAQNLFHVRIERQ